MNLGSYIRAGYPVLYLLTHEEMRAELATLHAVKAIKGRSIKTWSHTEGLTSPIDKAYADREALDPAAALMKIGKEPIPAGDGCVYVFRDLHKFFHIPKVLRLIRDHAKEFKQCRKTLIMICPVSALPPELERDAVLLEFDLPNRDEIGKLFDMMREQNQKPFSKIPDDEVEQIISAAMGLTSLEAENAIAKAAVDRAAMPEDKRPPISTLVMKEKALAVKKTGILEYFEAKESLHDIGGLDELKTWIEMRKKAYSKRARDFGLPLPRGIVLVGLPGCGKSMTAKATSNIMGVPLIRFDVGRVFAGLVGQSEQNMRTAIQTIDAIGPSVVWVDEMEKAFAGMGNDGAQDSGVGRRVFGSLITWMNEKKGGSFIVATVNKIESLPDELLRKGRFDEIFFVGLPSAKERAAIFEIQIKKYGRDPKNFIIHELVEHSTGFSGAEIEETIRSGLYTAFSLDKELSTDHVLHACLTTVPLSKSRQTQLDAMSKWAETNARKASKVDAPEEKAKGRSVDVE